jgi:hypothetical protein
MSSQLEHIELPAEELAALQEVTARAKRQLHASERFLGEVVEPPVPASPIAVAFANRARDEFDGGRLAIFAAEDHLRTILVVVDAGVLPGCALYTVLRGAVEAVARAAYLLEPTSVTERRAHALNLRLENLLEQAKVKRDDAKLTERRQHLEARAGLLGVQVLRSRSGRAMGFGEARRWPRSTATVSPWSTAGRPRRQPPSRRTTSTDSTSHAGKAGPPPALPPTCR